MQIGFIGAGKMARALAAGLARNGGGGEGFICCSRSRESAQAFLDLLVKQNPAPKWIGDSAQLVRSCDPIVLAIKPQQFAEVLPPLHEASAGKFFISLAAGVPLARIEAWLHPTVRVIRCMPNTPMQVGAGASVYAGGKNATEADLERVGEILSSSGKAWEVKESEIDTITALSGSGPAYVFHFIEALIQGSISLGLNEKLARELAIQTVLGSAQLAALSPLAPMDLAAQVKSPRGTTMAGCAELERDEALNRLMARCLSAAKARAEELTSGKA